MVSPSNWEQIRALFYGALERAPDERAAFLRAQSSNDEIRREVASLLAAHADADALLDAAGHHEADAPDPARPRASAPKRGGRAATLASGTPLGPYVVVSLLGAGAMGEVYRARDTNLRRDVALKVLPESLAANRDRLARFTREARTLGALNHPHIAQVHGFEEHGGVRALVMELVEGQDLAQHVARGPIRVEEALRIARQIAEALEAAHARGIVHRDLKPANIMIGGDGTVKVLDFGLAKAWMDDIGSATPPAGTSAAAPTMTAPPIATEVGVLVGSAAYMSPEQARGGSVDKGSDIWAFGCVLYEMLTGARAFHGAGAVDTLANVLQREPAWDQLPDTTPPSIRVLLRRCLRKDRRERLQDAAGLRIEIDDVLRDQDGSARTMSPPARVGLARGRGAFAAALGLLAAVLGVASMLALGWVAPLTSTPPTPTQRLSVELGADGGLATSDAPFALSPDGTLLAFVANPHSRAAQLHIRHLDQLTATPLGGTEGASTPFFSPDAKWVAFFADAKLKKVPVTGGAVVPLADAPQPRGGWWCEDETIVFAPTHRAGLVRVSSAGGPAQAVTTLTDGEITHRFPQVLPGGTAVLYTASTEVHIADGATLVVQPLPSGTRLIVQRGGYFGRYLASGHIAYLQEDTLFAMPFDGRRLEVTGVAGRMTAAVQSNAARGSAQLAVSQAGSIAYLQGRNTFGARPMAWLDRTGAMAPLRTVPDTWANPEFSPDGSRIALDIRRDGHSDIWIYEWARDSLTRLTTEVSNQEYPVWTPDGERIAYRSYRSSTDSSGESIVWRRADGSGGAQVLVQGKGMLRPGSWHPTQKVLAYVATMPRTGVDVMTLPVSGDEAGGWHPGQPTALVNGAAREQGPTFSPDGRWLAYTSNESGLDQVYVRPFPELGARVMVSSTGGTSASWSRTRREVVVSAPVADYVHALMVARYSPEGRSLRVDTPRLWADKAPVLRELLGGRMYALHPDGRRVVIAPPSEEETAPRTHLTFVLNIFDELRNLAPTKP